MQIQPDMFASKAEPTILKELSGEVVRPPPRSLLADRAKVKEDSKVVHYAFANVHKYPPARRRVRPAFQPWKIDARKFIVDKIRPHPEWPLICRVANLPAFLTEKAAKACNEHMHMPMVKLWECRHCGQWHYWSSTPTDSNGQFAAGAGDVPQRILDLI